MFFSFFHPRSDLSNWFIRWIRIRIGNADPDPVTQLNPIQTNPHYWFLVIKILDPHPDRIDLKCWIRIRIETNFGSATLFSSVLEMALYTLTLQHHTYVLKFETGMGGSDLREILFPLIHPLVPQGFIFLPGCCTFVIVYCVEALLLVCVCQLLYFNCPSPGTVFSVRGRGTCVPKPIFRPAALGNSCYNKTLLFFFVTISLSYLQCLGSGMFIPDPSFLSRILVFPSRISEIWSGIYIGLRFYLLVIYQC